MKAAANPIRKAVALFVFVSATVGCGTGGESRDSTDRARSNDTAIGTVGTMNATESEAVFRQTIERLGQNVEDLDAGQAVSAMLDFYRSTRAADVEDLSDGGDMLLFQWGTFDWGDGPTFQYDITRQFIVRGIDEPDEAIWQLSLTLHFSPDAQNAALEFGDRWCDDPAGIEGFDSFIASSAATAYARTNAPARVELTLGQAG